MRSVIEIDQEVLMGFIDVGDLMLVSIFSVLVTEIWYKWHLLDVGARRWYLKIVDVGDKNKTVTNNLKLSPIHFVSNIRH